MFCETVLCHLEILRDERKSQSASIKTAVGRAWGPDFAIRLPMIFGFKRLELIGDYEVSEAVSLPYFI